MNTIEQSKKEFGKRVVARRKDIRMTQDELAKLMGYKHRSAIQKIESGENSIPQDKIQKLAYCLQTSVSDLMGWVISETDATGEDISNYFFTMTREYLNNSVPVDTEFELLARYRKATDRDKQLIDSILSVYAGDEP